MQFNRTAILKIWLYFFLVKCNLATGRFKRELALEFFGVSITDYVTEQWFVKSFSEEVDLQKPLYLSLAVQYTNRLI